MRPSIAGLFFLLSPCLGLPAQDVEAARAALREDLSSFIELQRADKRIPAVCIACLDGAEGSSWKWSGGFGEARKGVPASVSTVHRVASISKLFTDTAAMVLVERGMLDLDEPVEKWIPDFAPRNPFGGKITLRHLMAHRAGLVREPPVGHYFDASAPSLEATVASLNETELVHAPGSAFKYSNPGVGVVGLVVARATGMPFERAVAELVLEPLGIEGSFEARGDLLAREAEGIMWTYDGRRIPTPEFPFGFGPAANLRCTAGDLVEFALSAFPGSERRVLSRESQERMFAVQFSESRSGCGLGWFVGELDGFRLVEHGGAAYGFASELAVLPDQSLAVAVVSTADFASAASEAIAYRALRGMLAARRGERLPAYEVPSPLGARRALSLAGRYAAGDRWLDLLARGEDLVLRPDSGVDRRLRLVEGSLISDDRTSMGDRSLALERGGVRFRGVLYRQRHGPPPEAPEDLLPYLGDYGWPFGTIIVYEDEGRLCVLIEWCVRAVLERRGEDLFRFPEGTMYSADLVRFVRDSKGRVTACDVGGARFSRLARDPGGEVYRIRPARPIEELKADALAASPPPSPAGLLDPDLVPLCEMVEGLHFDIRYATERNFLGARIYDRPAAMLQRPAAQALREALAFLKPRGLSLLVHDAYRPWWVTKLFWDATPEAQRGFVADPSRGSRHNRGCAVDLTLCDEGGNPVPMPSLYDEFTERAYPDYPGGTGRQRYHRELLRIAMARAGFEVEPFEWWHFDHETWRRYRVANEPLR